MELLTTREVAELLKTSERAVRAIPREELKPLRLKGLHGLRWEMDEVKRYIERAKK